MADAGHAAGVRMRDSGAFGDPARPGAALLVECGQHWARGSETVALETTIRFLSALEVIEASEAARFSNGATIPSQALIEVTEAVTVESGDFRFTSDYAGLEVIPEAGTEIARDGARPVLTPYDDCVLVMPSKRSAPGETAVRLGRWTEHLSP
jgi:hypothetical protein